MSEPEHERQFRLFSQCRSCNADVIWAKHETTGKWHPFNAEPVRPEGTHTFVLRGDEAIAVPPSVFSDEPHYVSHFSTCPHAAEWRRERRSA